ncbi:MAG: hypothetical protein ACPGNT_05300 [Rhodospirillales bacterium]
MSTTISELAFLAAPTFRSRAYAQMMAQSGILPNTLIKIPGDEPDWRGPERVTIPAPVGDGWEGMPDFSFAPGESVQETLGHRVERQMTLPVRDLHDASSFAGLMSVEEDVFLFSSFGGDILRDPVIDCGKRFLHIHGGWAPDYRGSTCFLYSLLRDGEMGATAIWLERLIDTGPVLDRYAYRPPVGIDLDRIGEPAGRAMLLARVLRRRIEMGRFPDGCRDDGPGETFHVIHPVLKHLALRRRKS